MKYITIFILLILMGMTVQAQDTDVPKRNISLLIRNKKGRPIEKVIVRSLSNAHAGMTNRKGMFVFTDMADNDEIFMYLPKYGEAVVPVAGMDLIVITLHSARRYSFVNSESQNIIIERKNKTDPNELIDVQALLAQHPYKSLIELLQGANVPGLNITSPSGTGGRGTSVEIRGQHSLLGSNEPLAVLDGMPIGGLGDANAIVNVNDVKTIEIQKGGSEWGVRGANGVIVINTR